MPRDHSEWDPENIPETNCSACRYSQAKPREYYYICRRYPPNEDGYPVVHENDWCGEFNT